MLNCGHDNDPGCSVRIREILTILFMKRGFYNILAAQFLSSLADNALLIAAIALLASIQAPDWMTPLLKLFFVLSYVGLAAWVGIFADLMPKGRVMFITNAVKVFGCLLMLFGSHPLLSYAVVGIGAAAYSPAKYGILTELLPPEKLVIANGWIEGLTVVSIILGVVLGGVLIKPEVAGYILQTFHLPAIGLDTDPEAALFIVGIVYALAAAVNLTIPDTGVRYARPNFEPIASIKNFFQSCSLLWHDKLGQISLSVTTLFWGAGAVLQFLVLKWAEQALGMHLSDGAILQAVVSIGIALGAVGAAAFIPLKKSLVVLPMGVAMGLVVGGASFYDQSLIPGVVEIFGFEIRNAVIGACGIMIAVGVLAGFFVVPMNALLQHRGHVLMSAGRSIAVQNFNENLSILVMLAVYSLLIHLDFSVQAAMVMFGAFVALSMFCVILRHRSNQKKGDSLHLIGEDVYETVITWDDYARKAGSTGYPMGTSATSTVFMHADDFLAENITFENTAGEGKSIGQACAITVDGDRAAFINCRFIANQDTVYNFGPGQRQYFRDCYIEGTTDFIFGFATAYFDGCTIMSKKNSYVTAAATPEGAPYGYVFRNCRLVHNGDASEVYLGRPWRPYAKTVFIECRLGDHILPAGWHNWNKPDAEKTSFYAEYGNTGPGAAGKGERVPWSHFLKGRDLQKYTPEAVLGPRDAVKATTSPEDREWYFKVF